MIIQSNKISLTLQDTDAAKKVAVSVPNAKDGNISHIYEGATMEGPVQNEAGKATSIYTEAEAKQLHIDETELPDDGSMSPADFISQCMTGEDAQALSDEETPLEEYTSSQLDRAIHRIKEERHEKEEAVESYVSREKEEAQAIEDAAIATMVAEGQISSLAVEQAKQSELPLLPENVMRLSHAIEMTSAIRSFSQASMKFFIGKELSITPENIHNSQYHANEGVADNVANANNDFTEVENQVRDLLTENGVTPDQETMDTAKWLYENDLPVTAENIKTTEQLEQLKNTDTKVLSERIADQMAEGVHPQKANLMKLSVAEAITARRQLEETRLTMSIEAVRNMAAKGIDLDISNLEEIVNELRLQEQQAKQAMMEETGLPITDDNEQMFADTLQAAKSVLAAPVEFLGHALETADVDTLHSLSERAVVFTADYSKAEQSYESVGTEVRRDLGDSIQKAFRNVDDILQDLGMEQTAANERAVRGLAYNQMELTEENVMRMKEYDSRITSLMKDMKPQVVSELIQRQINPLEVSLEELSEHVATIQQEIGVEDVSFSRYLWRLEHQNEITPEERESMIGIYRLLDKIEKSDGAAAGQLLKEGRELSMEALLSAIRTRRDAGMDVQVNDEFGGLQDVIMTGTTISDQIQAAYNRSQAKEIKQELSRLAQPDAAEYYETVAQDAQQTMAMATERVQEFLKVLELPDTMANLQFAQAFLRQSGKDWRSYFEPEDSEEILEKFEDPEKLDEVYENLDKKHHETLAKMKEADDISYESVRAMTMMGRRISFFSQLRKHQMYEVPVFTEQGITTCNVTIQSGNQAEKGTVEIDMESAEFGRLQASFKISGHRVKGFVTVENKDVVSECQTRMNQFEKDLRENGYTMDSGSLVAGSRDSLHVGDRAEGAKNKDLYQVAKCFIVSMNRKDDAE